MLYMIKCTERVVGVCRVNERLVEPQTRDTVTVSELAPNRALYSEISEWLQYVKETYNANQR